MPEKIKSLYLNCLIKENEVLTFVNDYLKENNLEMDIGAYRLSSERMKGKMIAVFGLDEDKSNGLYSILKIHNLSDKMIYE